MEIIVRNQDIDAALRQLKRLTDADGLLKEVKLRRAFETRREKRQRKHRMAMRRSK